MNFIVIEGLDGSGKSTQIQNLKNRLDLNKTPYFYLHFPRTNAPVFGSLISRFLRGEFGSIDNVNPYLVSLIYAGDRMDASNEIRKKLERKKLVIVDRYVLSNIAYQCAKVPDQQDQLKLRDWILHLEYEYYKIPKPDLNIFLDVPFRFTQEKLTGTRNGADREYLDGNHDIHEEDLNFQQKVRKNYLTQALTDPSLKIINCSDSEGSMLSSGKIFKKLINILTETGIIYR